MRRILALTLLTLATPAWGGSHTEAERAQLIAAAVASPARSAEHRARDKYRHPAQTLAFFGLHPGMTVVEIQPGGGWYTEILAPAVGSKGKVIAVVSADARASASNDKLRARLAGDKNLSLASTLGKPAIVPPGTADMVLTFRNVHNWMGAGTAPMMFKAFHDALKPGGVLGVEEHRLPESRTQDPKAASGYVKQSEVIRMAEAAGFRLAAKSEVNANPRDTADYPKGVWTLPPNYAEGDATKAKYAAVGESDRMTLRFVKG